MKSKQSMGKKNSQFALIVLAMTVIPGASFGASNIQCSGYINSLAVKKDNSVFVYPDWKAGGRVKICELSGSWQNISTLTCATWISTIKTAMSTPTPSQVELQSWTDFTCDQTGEYAAPNQVKLLN